MITTWKVGKTVRFQTDNKDEANIMKSKKGFTLVGNGVNVNMWLFCADEESIKEARNLAASIKEEAELRRLLT